MMSSHWSFSVPHSSLHSTTLYLSARAATLLCFSFAHAAVLLSAVASPLESPHRLLVASSAYNRIVHPLVVRVVF